MDRIGTALEGVSPLCPETAMRQDMRCKVCGGGDIRDFDLVDANKICSEIEPYPYGLSGVGVRYVRCGACGFVFTSEFDSWGETTFARHIYNDDYIKVDGEYPEVRPRQCAERVATLLRDLRALRILDYGSGSGVFADEMARRGFKNVASFDPFSSPDRPTGVFDVVTCIETIEHVPDPVGALKAMSSLLRPGGVILLQTGMQPPDINRLRGRWWYIAPRNGHISIFGHPSMHEAARRAGLAFHLGANQHNLLCHNGMDIESQTVLAALGGGSAVRYERASLPTLVPGEAAWFDAAIVAPTQEALRRRPSRLRSGLGRVARVLTPGRSPLARAEEARGNGQWERAARFYTDALILEPDASALWIALADTLERVGRPDDAVLARRHATKLRARNRDMAVTP